MLLVSCSILTVSYVHVNRFTFSMLQLTRRCTLSLHSFFGVLDWPNNHFLELNFYTTYQGMCTLLFDNLFWLSFSVFIICGVVYYWLWCGCFSTNQYNRFQFAWKEDRFNFLTIIYWIRCTDDVYILHIIIV